MLSSVLRSPTAVQVIIAIMRAFVPLRRANDRGRLASRSILTRMGSELDGVLAQKSTTVETSDISDQIRIVRGQRVLLDFDLAQLYGVETRTLNQAVRRNLQRFPADFLLQLTDSEIDSLRSQSVILKLGRGRHRKFLPLAFTEHGAIMAATILNSPRAIEMSVYVVRAFLKLRNCCHPTPSWPASWKPWRSRSLHWTRIRAANSTRSTAPSSRSWARSQRNSRAVGHPLSAFPTLPGHMPAVIVPELPGRISC